MESEAPSVKEFILPDEVREKCFEYFSKVTEAGFIPPYTSDIALPDKSYDREAVAKAFASFMQKHISPDIVNALQGSRQR